MCGITAIFNIREDASALRGQALEMSKRIRHRGPDWSGIYQGRTAILPTNAFPSSTQPPVVSL